MLDILIEKCNIRELYLKEELYYREELLKCPIIDGIITEANIIIHQSLDMKSSLHQFSWHLTKILLAMKMTSVVLLG